MIERRKDRRYGTAAMGAMSARVRPGHDVVVIDVSSSGALIEIATPLRPGARVHVQLKAPASSAAVVARVTRCAVAALGDAGVTYRAGLRLDHGCDWASESITRQGNDVPGNGSIGSCRAGQVLPEPEPRFMNAALEPSK